MLRFFKLNDRKYRFHGTFGQSQKGIKSLQQAATERRTINLPASPEEEDDDKARIRKEMGNDVEISSDCTGACVDGGLGKFELERRLSKKGGDGLKQVLTISSLGEKGSQFPAHEEQIVSLDRILARIIDSLASGNPSAGFSKQEDSLQAQKLCWDKLRTSKNRPGSEVITSNRPMNLMGKVYQRRKMIGPNNNLIMKQLQAQNQLYIGSNTNSDVMKRSGSSNQISQLGLRSSNNQTSDGLHQLRKSQTIMGRFRFGIAGILKKNKFLMTGTIFHTENGLFRKLEAGDEPNSRNSAILLDNLEDRDIDEEQEEQTVDYEGHEEESVQDMDVMIQKDSEMESQKFEDGEDLLEAYGAHIDETEEKEQSEGELYDTDEDEGDDSNVGEDIQNLFEQPMEAAMLYKDQVKLNPRTQLTEILTTSKNRNIEINETNSGQISLFSTTCSSILQVSSVSTKSSFNSLKSGFILLDQWIG